AIVWAFLRPVDLLALRVNRDPYAPPCLIPAIYVATTGLNKRFNLRAIKIRAHHAHSFAIAPVDFAISLVELELFRRERNTLRNDHAPFLPVKSAPLYQTIIYVRNPHFPRKDVPGRTIARIPMGKRTFVKNPLLFGPGGAHGVNPPATQLK